MIPRLFARVLGPYLEIAAVTIGLRVPDTRALLGEYPRALAGVRRHRRPYAPRPELGVGGPCVGTQEPRTFRPTDSGIATAEMRCRNTQYVHAW